MSDIVSRMNSHYEVPSYISAPVGVLISGGNRNFIISFNSNRNHDKWTKQSRS